jgi:hypothetical protein
VTQKLGNKVLPASTKGGKLTAKLRECVKSQKEGAPADQFQPKRKGPYPVILATLTLVKVHAMASWIHLSRLKHNMHQRNLLLTKPNLRTFTPVSQ